MAISIGAILSIAQTVAPLVKQYLTGKRLRRAARAAATAVLESDSAAGDGEAKMQAAMKRTRELSPAASKLPLHRLRLLVQVAFDELHGTPTDPVDTGGPTLDEILAALAALEQQIRDLQTRIDEGDDPA